MTSTPFVLESRTQCCWALHTDDTVLKKILKPLTGPRRRSASELERLAATSGSVVALERNASALEQRLKFRSEGFPPDVKTLDLRKQFPYWGFVDVSIRGVPPFVMFSNNDDFVAERYFWFGGDAYEPMSLRVWAALASRSSNILDIGSYTGVFGLAAATVNRKSKVCSIEALDRVYSRLLINRNANSLTNLKTLHFAMGEGEGEATLHVHSAENILVTASSTIESARPTLEKKIVRTTSVDRLIEEGTIEDADLIKIDAEGAEHLVLHGSRTLLERRKPDLICELLKRAEIEEVRTLLARLGYSAYKIDDKRMTLIPSQASAATGMHDLNTLFSMRTLEELNACVASLDSR